MRARRLINITWKTGQLPTDWKTAIHLLKKNNPESAPSSYRTISLTSCIGTAVERMINERLNWWLKHYIIITSCQADVRSNYVLHMNKDTIAVFIDLEKSYDKVWRQRHKDEICSYTCTDGITTFSQTIDTQQLPPKRNLSHKQNCDSTKVYTTRQLMQLHPLHPVHQWH